MAETIFDRNVVFGDVNILNFKGSKLLEQMRKNGADRILDLRFACLVVGKNEQHIPQMVVKTW